MKKQIPIYVVLILLSSIFLSGCTKKTEKEVTPNTDSNQEEESKDTTAEEDSELGYLKSTQGYIKEKQVLGVPSDFKYTIEKIETGSGEGYQSFEFTMSSSDIGATVPLFTIEPILSKGVYRVSLVNIYDDNTSVTHSKGITVNKGAITGLTRIVTSSDTTRAYDIGILSDNLFNAEVNDSGDGTWVFSVKVAYDTDYKAPSIDFGSTEFSSDLQSIEGMSSSDGAKITDYSFLMSGGVVKFSLEVASGTSNPIPSVTAQYNDAGLLVVNFPSLQQDKVSGWDSTISLPAGISVEISRVGEASEYVFSGISNKKQFKLSATQSPNLVIIEIKLN